MNLLEEFSNLKEEPEQPLPYRIGNYLYYERYKEIAYEYAFLLNLAGIRE